MVIYYIYYTYGIYGSVYIYSLLVCVAAFNHLSADKVCANAYV